MEIFGLVFIPITNDGSKITNTPVPLQNVQVEANVVDMIAEVKISQTYKNVEKNTIDAFYKFPIHEAAAVCGFEAELDDGRIIKGIVKGSTEAAKEYEKAVLRGQGAYLLEETLPDVFQCSLGNISSGQTIIIRITYVTELKHDAESEKIRFVLPTVVSPRYAPENFSEKSTDADKIVTAENPSYVSTAIAKYTLGLSITCRMTDAITSIESPSHKISTELNINGDAKVSRISLAEEITYLERDFILVVKSNGLDEPRAFIEYNSKTETNAVMLTLVPKFSSSSAKMSEMIFVVDRSGSMSDGPIRKASQALQLILRSLPENCLFNIVSFGSEFDSLFKESERYSEKTFSLAISHAESMDADYGGTEIKNVLEWVVKTARSDMPTSVFLLTDGEVWNVEEIVQLIRKTASDPKKSFRLFSLGIGSSVSHHLVESIARAGNGYAQFVTDEERMDKKVIGMVKNAMKCALIDYKIEWIDKTKNKSIISFPWNSSKKNENDVIRQAPHTIPAIYSGVRVVVYAILAKGVEPKKVLTLSAQSLDGPIKLDVNVDPVTLQGSKIHTLAARKLIQDLEEGTSFLHTESEGKNKTPGELVKEQIINLGKVLLSTLRRDIPAIDEKTKSEIARSETLKQKREVPVQAMNAMTTMACVSSSPLRLRKASSGGGAIGLYSDFCDSSSVSEECAYSFTQQIRRQEEPLPSPSFDIKAPTIDTLYAFLKLQTFDGKFVAKDSNFSNLFSGNDSKRDDNLEWTTAVAMAYLEIVMKEFKEEWELCYEKAERALINLVGESGGEKKVENLLAEAREWVQKCTSAGQSIAVNSNVSDTSKFVKGRAFDRLFFIIFENTNYEDAIADPYFKSLTEQGLFFTNYHAIAHPSEPNYLALISAQTFEKDQQYTRLDLNSTTLIDLFEPKGITWKSYQENYPGNCYKEYYSPDGKYAERHNPFMSFLSISGVPARCARVVPAPELDVDISQNNLPQYMFYTPNLDNDAHDTNITFASAYFSKFLNPKLKNPNFFDNRTLIVITFDESESYNDTNQIYTLLLGSAIDPSLRGKTDNTPYDHYSMLRSIEVNWDLGSLGRNDTNATVFKFITDSPPLLNDSKELKGDPEVKTSSYNGASVFISSIENTSLLIFVLHILQFLF
ncbi:6984_t:CDS:10 [Ambispora leptoticha]|uniref:6984_t:CDS:1 n=1 Tax=Ambispora leptoticha TaxID=144679 RepID=A0A9N8ZV33_9GLOM|nr:6984_t:CDS:10 [Ambispora leptoticha]